MEDALSSTQPYSPRLAKEMDTVVRMTHKLSADIAGLEKLADGKQPNAVPAYRRIRDIYMEIVGLIDTISQRPKEALEPLQPGLRHWLARAHIRAIGLYARVSHAFFFRSDNVVLGSLVARDVLMAEHRTLVEALEALADHDQQDLPQEPDQDSADDIRERLTRVVDQVNYLSEHTPNPLTEF